MAQTGAAREPSMEEILASIRRIIETNDAASPDRAETRPQLAAVREIPSPPPAVESQVDARSDAYAEEPVVPSPSSARTISLADVAARLRSTPDVQPPHIASGEAVAVHDVAEEDEVVVDHRFEIGDEADDDQTDDNPWDRMSDDEDFEQPASEQEWPDLGAIDQSASVLQLREQPIEEPREDAVPNEARSHELISSAAGAKVAAAFEDLSEAVVRGQMRSFDDIAEDMLRPMLKDWLDDNLPTLVERLVREEIERVARGGRR